MWNNLGVFFDCHGLYLAKGSKQKAMISGSHIDVGQKWNLFGILIIKSAALFNCLYHRVVISRGTRMMCVDFRRLRRAFLNSLKPASAAAGAGLQTKEPGLVLILQ